MTDIVDDIDMLCEYCLSNAEEDSFLDMIEENGLEEMSDEDIEELIDIRNNRNMTDDKQNKRFVELMALATKENTHVFAVATRVFAAMQAKAIKA